MPPPKIVTSWGRRFHYSHHGKTPQWLDQTGSLLNQAREQSLPILAHGQGRSYGDSCLNQDGMLINTSHLNRFIEFDAAQGTLSCEAGTTLDQILDLIVPTGWFLPVTPGTRFVSVGGAIANDVHGKNHHLEGTFGRHVLTMDLQRSDGSIHTLTQSNENHALFEATVGGLGLTGLILRATLRLRPIHNPWMDSETVRFKDLAGFFALSKESDQRFEYTVSWLDCLAKGANLGRGLFMRANHCEPGQLPDKGNTPGGNLNMPFTPPVSLVNKWSLAAFNQLYYHKQRSDRIQSIDHYQPYFYPLDSIGHWNRMYGPKGFVQYQCVLPTRDAQDAAHAFLERIAKSGQGSFLAVMKIFGAQSSPGMLSFPMPGATLATDFAWHGDKTEKLLKELDAIVQEAGGRLYPAKDSRMSPADFETYYPRLDEFLVHLDPAFSSSFWRRVQAPA